MVDDIIVEDGNICSAAAHIDKCDACLAFIVAKDSVGRGYRLKYHVFHLQPGTLKACQDVLGRGNLTDDDMEVCLKLASEHSLRLAYSRLIVNDILLWDNVYYLLTRLHTQLEHILTELFYLLFGNLHVRVITHQHTTVLQTLDMMAGDTDVNSAYLHIRLFGSLVNSTTDSVDRLLYVKDHPTFHSRRFSLPITENGYLSVPNLLSYKTGNLRSTDIKSYNIS